MGQARDHTLPHWITDSAHDDRDGLRGPLRLERRLGAPRENDVDLEGHEVLGQLTEPLVPAFGVPVLVADILVLDIAELLQPLPERIDRWECLDGQDPDRRDLARGLRPGHGRRGEEDKDEERSDPNRTLPHSGLLPYWLVSRSAGGSLGGLGGPGQALRYPTPAGPFPVA